MSIFDKLTVREAPFLPALNTGTLVDIATGHFVPAADGSHILNGGIVLTNAKTGRPQMFKSTNALGEAVNAYARYPGSDFIVNDTERTLQKERILSMADVPIPHNNAFKLTTRAEYYAEDFFDLIRGIADEKSNHKNDWLVEAPHIDLKTGKPYRIFRPTFVGIDSWSNMPSRVVENMLLSQIKVGEDGEVSSKTSITDSDTNTAFMRDGLAKKKILTQLNGLAERAGIYFFFTAHIGDKIEMNPYAPSPKSLQHMRMSDKPKGVGADFMFLMMNLLDCREAKVLLNDADKSTMYPTKDSRTGDVDLNTVTQVVTRCKGNISGQQVSMVVSQSEGVMPALSNYHMLKIGKYWGLDGNPMRHAPVLMPDVILQRTTVNDLLRQNPQLRRALEILAQLYYVQTHWTTRGAPVNFGIDPKALADKLMSSAASMSDILDSRGWWTYTYDGWKSDQNYLSLYDILGIVEGSYKPKWLSLKGIAANKDDVKKAA